MMQIKHHDQYKYMIIEILTVHFEDVTFGDTNSITYDMIYLHNYLMYFKREKVVYDDDALIRDILWCSILHFH